MNNAARLVLLASVTTLASCGILRHGSSKKNRTPKPALDTAIVQVPAPPTPPPTAPSDPAEVAKREAMRPIVAPRIQYTTFSGKAKMRYETAEDKKDFTANIRMEAGKSVWASISALGGLVNVARALITPDSVKIINYLSKEVYLMRYEDAHRFLPVQVPFSALQELFAGNALLATSRITGSTEDAATWTVQTAAAPFQQTLIVNKGDTTLKTVVVRSTAASPSSVVVSYGDYADANGRRFSRTREATLQSGQKRGVLGMEFDNPTWDRPVEMPFSIPSKYTVK